MLERSTWPMTLVVALLVSWVEPAPCSAQSQPLPLPTSTPTESIDLVNVHDAPGLPAAAAPVFPTGKFGVGRSGGAGVPDSRSCAAPRTPGKGVVDDRALGFPAGVEPRSGAPGSDFGPRPRGGRPGLEAQARAAGADRPSLPDQPGHRLAALRRPAADRGRRAGQRVGGRGRAHAGQGPLGPHAQHRLRLSSGTTAAARTSTRAS